MPPKRKPCPKCKAIVELTRTARGLVYSCKACGRLERVQEKEEIPEVLEDHPADISDAANTEEAKRHRQRLKKARTRRAQESGGELAEGVTYYLQAIGVPGFMLIGLLLFLLCGCPLMIVIRPFAVAVVFVGFASYLTGRFWIAYIVYQESPAGAVACIIFEPAAIYFGIISIGEAWRQLLLMFFGAMVFGMGLVGALASGMIRGG
jgi:hypothetical protein